MSLRWRIKTEQGERDGGIRVWSTPVHTVRQPHATLHPGNLADKAFMNSKLNQGLLNNKSISKCPRDWVSEWLPSCSLYSCNIVARSLCLLKAVEQRESPHILGGSHLQRLQHWQADVDSNQTSFYVYRMGALFSEMLPIFAALHSWWFRFPFGFASHSGVAATPRKRKRLIKCAPVGYLKMYACKNKDPGKSGLFHWIEMQPSRSLSNRFYLLWLFSCQIVSSALPPRKLQARCVLHISWSLLRFTFIESVISNRLSLYCPLLLPSIFANIRVFSNESALHIRWPKYWSFSFCISPSSEYSGLISFRMDWLDLLAVQGTLKSLLQHMLYCVQANLVYLLLCLRSA